MIQNGEETVNVVATAEQPISTIILVIVPAYFSILWVGIDEGFWGLRIGPTLAGRLTTRWISLENSLRKSRS